MFLLVALLVCLFVPSLVCFLFVNFHRNYDGLNDGDALTFFHLPIKRKVGKILLFPYYGSERFASSPKACSAF